MAQKSPNAIDVLDIQFKLYAKTKILNLSESIPNNINLLTTSNARGLLFVGEPEKPELKVFMLNNLIDTENVCNEILARAIQLPGVPNIIVCSCDGNMLAVSYNQNGSSFLQIFSVAAFLAPNIQTLHTIKLAADDHVAPLQILWNPVIASNLAIVLSNGALGMYNLKDGQYEMHSLDKSQQVQCGCWSPKGKQIVLGFANGKLQQFKPDLTPAKTIVCPVGVHAGPFSTIAVHWLSTFQFAVAFVQDGDDMVPSLYIVNAPKGGTPSYINYFDVCYTTGQRVNQMSFVHIQQWNLLLVSSANGIEVGLLGYKESGDNPTWIQYTLLDEARIEMPLTESKDETFPIGFAFDTSCTHHLTINDKELPTMPMVHVLTTNGQLLSFNFLNLTPDAPDVCSPPPPISYNTQQFRPLEEHLKTDTVEVVAATQPPIQYEKTPNAVPSSLVASTPVMKDKAPTFFGNLNAPVAQQQFTGLSGFGSTASQSSNIAANQATKTIFSEFGGLGGLTAPASDLGGQQQILDQQQSTQAKPQSQPHLQQQQQQQQLQKPQQFSTVAVSGVKSSELNKPLYTVPSDFTPTIGATAQQSQPRKSQSNMTISSKMQSGFFELIVVQINAFDKEIKLLAAQSKGLLKNLGNPDEMRGCTKRLNDLQEIIEQANDHEFEMDVQNLRHFLTEARAMIAECRWKLEKHKNPELPRVGNNTSDPVNRRQLVKLQSYLAMNEAQMQVLKLQIDAQWSNFQDSVRRNTKSQIHIPCLDGIYQRMTKLQESLSRHRQKLNRIKMKLQQNGLLYKITNADTSRSHVNVDSAIDSLADSLLSVTLAPVVNEHRSKLSKEKLDAIRNFTRQRQTLNIIKPQRPNRVGLNSEVVLETMLQSERNKARANNTKIEAQEGEESAQTHKQPQITLSKDSNSSGLFNTEDMSKTLSIPNQQAPLKTSMSSPVFTFNLASSNNITKTATAIDKDEKSAPFSFNFKTPLPNMSSFGKPLSGSTPFELSKGVPTTSEDEAPGTAQVPISFAAKVISGTSAVTTNSSTTLDTTITGIGIPNTITTEKDSKVGEDAPKPFSFMAGLSNSNNIFGGIGADATKPQGFDLKSGAGLSANFSFGGFTSTAANTTVSTTMPAVVSLTTVPTTVNVASAPTPTASILSGFGKPVAVDNNATPLNLSPAVSSANGSMAQNLTKSTTASTPITSFVTSLVPDSSGTVVNTVASDSTTDAADSLFGSLNICKPTVKPADLSKSPSSTSNIFAGLAASSGFSFTPVTGAGGNIFFGNLSKPLSTNASLTITSVTTTPPPTTTTTMASTITMAKNVSTTPTTATLSTTSIASATITPVKPIDFTFSLGCLGTTITTATTTTSLPTTSNSTTTTTTLGISSAATSIFSSPATTTTSTSVPSGIFASAAFPVSASTVPSSTPSFFGGVSSGGATFFTSTAPTPTPATTTSAGGSIFGTVTLPSLTTNFTGFNLGTTASTGSTPSASGGGGLFATASAGGASPHSNNIFGGIPKPDQSVFGGAATQTQPSTGNLFASAAPNASPFAASAMSPPPNQNVGGSIFGGGSDAFSKPAGSIFGGNPTTATSANTIGSPFGSAIVTTSASGTSIFGSSAGKPVDGGSIFSSATLQPVVAGGGGASGGGSIFGQSSFGQIGAGTTPSSNLFGSGAGDATQSGFGTGGAIFGGNAASSGGSIFGGVAAQSTFGSPSNTTGASGFGAFSQQNAGSPFGSPAAASGPFGQGGASVAQTGFGSPQQTSAFSKPIFGGPATFGSPPAFGAQTTFGGAPTFGSQKAFGSFASAAPASPPSGVFGGATQKNNLFETLGSTDTGLSFGNLAQGANAGGPKPPFGGSSFTSYRS